MVDKHCIYNAMNTNNNNNIKIYIYNGDLISYFYYIVF